MDVLRLSESDARLLAARCAEHGNSYLRMSGALREAGAGEVLDRLRALRRLERAVEVDLGSLCHRYLNRREEGTHPLERRVLGWVAHRGVSPDGCPELWVLLDRLRQIRDLIDGRQVAGR